MDYSTLFLCLVHLARTPIAALLVRIFGVKRWFKNCLIIFTVIQKLTCLAVLALQSILESHATGREEMVPLIYNCTAVTYYGVPYPI